MSKMDTITKIDAAREILKNAELQNDEKLAQRLKELTDRFELAYNDAKVKCLRSDKALNDLKHIENKLDALLTKAENLNDISQN